MCLIVKQATKFLHLLTQSEGDITFKALRPSCVDKAFSKRSTVKLVKSVLRRGALIVINKLKLKSRAVKQA